MGTAAVSNSDCGVGFIYNAGGATELCVGIACDMSVTADKAACCVACTAQTGCSVNEDFCSVELLTKYVVRRMLVKPVSYVGP